MRASKDQLINQSTTNTSLKQYGLITAINWSLLQNFRW